MASLFIAVLFLFGFSLTKGQDCAWNKDLDYPVIPPLLIDLASWTSLKAVDEGGLRIVRVPLSTTIVISCTGTLITSLGLEVAEGVCAGGQFLDIGGTQYTIQDLGCTDNVKDSILITQDPCGNNGIGEYAQLGFDVPGYQFFGVVRICFEHINEIALYSEDIIYGANVGAGDGNPEKPSFTQDDYYYPTINPNDCYLTANQDAYFTNFTGDANFIDLNTDIYFARGHLSPNGDFLIDMEADASYYYLNAMPQWQIFNAGNWASLESNARALAEAHVSDLHTFTGPWQNLVMNDINNNPTTLYICNDQNQQIIPIPSLIWKVIYEPSTDRGVAVITSNYPHETVPQTPLCADICASLSWITFTPTDVSRGFTYCCTVQDWKAVNPNAPDLPTATLLSD